MVRRLRSGNERLHPVTEDLLDVLYYSTGVEQNDKAFRSSFPYVAQPFSGAEVDHRPR